MCRRWLIQMGMAACVLSAPATSVLANDVLFSESFDNGSGQFTIKGNVSSGSYGVRMRSGLRGDGSITSNPINVSGYQALTLSYRRSVYGLDEGEMAKASYSLDGDHFVELETLSSGRGNVSLDLKNVPQSAASIILRFELDANSYSERYTISQLQLLGELNTGTEDMDEEENQEDNNENEEDNTDQDNDDQVGSVDDPECLGEIDANSPILTNGFGSDIKNTGNVSSPINASNVDKLAFDYAFVSEETDTKRGAPMVTEQAAFIYGLYTLHAINRKTGCEYWRYQSDIAFKSSSILLVPSEGMLFVGDSKGYAHAINAKTGELVWKDFIGVDDSSASAEAHVSTGGMQYHNGLLVVPVSSIEVLQRIVSPCCENHGIVRAYDAKTGKDVWEYHTTENASLIGNSRGPSGAPVWSTPTIDKKRNAVYFGTGQNYSKPASNTSDAIIALDLMSGTEKWVFQASEGDIWNAHTLAALTGKDYDFGGSPILLEDGSAILAGDKASVVYSLDPETGKLNWKRKLGSGGTLGGVHWNMAVDERHVYAGISDVSSDKVNPDLSVPGEARPGVYALNLINGDIVWEQHPTHDYRGEDIPSLYSASVTVTNNVLFAASLDGVVKAFHTETGKELWSFDTAIEVDGVNGVRGNGGTIDSVGAIVAGDQVYINSGYNKFGGTNRYQAGPGNALFVLKLKQ